MPKKQDEQRPVFKQYVPGKKDVEFLSGCVERPFYCKCGTVDGPPVVVPAGAEFLCTAEFFKELFYANRLSPWLLDIDQYTVIRSFRTVQDGLFVDLALGAVLQLTRAEALDLLRKNLITIYKQEEEK
jgi:hypothetical protein